MKKRDPKSAMQGGFSRLGVVPVEAVLPHVREAMKHNRPRGTDRVDLLGHSVNLVSTRLYCFADKGVRCVKCGIEGRFFAIEKNKSAWNPHANLYALKEDGTEVLMTRDHVIPVSKGGPDVLENCQTMCKQCNTEKGDKYEVKRVLG
jgi:hypothetical protein